MKGDSIVIEAHHGRAARGIFDLISAQTAQAAKYVLTIAGESGSGKSEVAAALAACCTQAGITTYVFQQDDYFVYPPRSNDRARRADIGWVGPQEVRLDLLDAHLKAFRGGAQELVKPLVVYGEDRIDEETSDLATIRVAIAEGTYTTLLEAVDTHVFIDRTYEQTRAHRRKRRRDAAELDPFIEQVLAIEHDIIARHRERAQIVVAADYSVSGV